MVDETPSAGSPQAHAALDAALAASQKAIGGLRRLQHEIDDAAGAGRSWLVALFSMFSRLQTRRRIQQMTAAIQFDLAALDAAVEAVRAAGMPLGQLGDLQASRARRRDVQAEAPPGPADAWSGPRHLVEATLQRVTRIDDELRRLRGGT
jgi:hypothetical protein